jgi:hypothetical protein
MNYQSLRAEAVKISIALTNAMLCKDEQLIQLETFKLNNIIAEMLDIMKKDTPKYENTYTEAKRTYKSSKR